MSFDRTYEKALRAVKARKKRKKAAPAKTRYGYLIVDWPLIEDEFNQSAGGAYMLGEEEDLTISRGKNPISQKAQADNLERLRADTSRILGNRHIIVSHNGYLYIKTKAK